jgi:hypothetical protein
VDREHLIANRIHWSVDELGQAARIMFGVFLAVLQSLGAAFQSHRQLLLENLALRHQLMVLSLGSFNACKDESRSPEFSQRIWACHSPLMKPVQSDSARSLRLGFCRE